LVPAAFASVEDCSASASEFVICGGWGEWLYDGGRSRIAGIPVHGRGVLRPHLAVHSLVGGDRRGVLTQDVRGD